MVQFQSVFFVAAEQPSLRQQRDPVERGPTRRLVNMSLARKEVRGGCFVVDNSPLEPRRGRSPPFLTTRSALETDVPRRARTDWVAAAVTVSKAISLGLCSWVENVRSGQQRSTRAAPLGNGALAGHRALPPLQLMSPALSTGFLSGRGELATRSRPSSVFGRSAPRVRDSLR